VAPSRNGIDVLLPLTVGIATTVCTIFIHGLALTAIVHFVRRERRLGHAGVRFWKDVPIVAGATLLALAAHLIEMAAWALVFLRCGEFRDFAAACWCDLKVGDVSELLRRKRSYASILCGMPFE
jgi:hypothetical protein